MQEASAGDAGCQLLQAGLDGSSIALPHCWLQAALVPLRPVLYERGRLRISWNELILTCS